MLVDLSDIFVDDICYWFLIGLGMCFEGISFYIFERIANYSKVVPRSIASKSIEHQSVNDTKTISIFGFVFDCFLIVLGNLFGSNNVSKLRLNPGSVSGRLNKYHEYLWSDAVEAQLPSRKDIINGILEYPKRYRPGKLFRG